MPTAEEIILGGRLPERTEHVCLRGDLAADFEAAEQELSELDVAGRDQFGGSAGTAAVVARLAALRDEMREHTVVFRLRALPRPTYRALAAEHPPRDGNDMDASHGVNQETFYPALIRACTVDPQLSESTWGVLFTERLTDKQYDQLAGVALSVNRSRVDVPFLPAVSTTLSSEPE